MISDEGEWGNQKGRWTRVCGCGAQDGNQYILVFTHCQAIRCKAMQGCRHLSSEPCAGITLTPASPLSLVLPCGVWHPCTNPGRSRRQTDSDGRMMRSYSATIKKASLHSIESNLCCSGNRRPDSGAQRITDHILWSFVLPYDLVIWNVVIETAIVEQKVLCSTHWLQLSLDFLHHVASTRVLWSLWIDGSFD